jgi:hypothetical protein
MTLSKTTMSISVECHYAESRIFYCYAQRLYAECRYVVCRYAECGGAK